MVGAEDHNRRGQLRGEGMTVRKLQDGKEVAVKRRDGVRKICRCPQAKQTKCKHPWHFAYQHEGKHYRFSLNRFLGKPDLSKTEAQEAAENIRIEIRECKLGTAESTVAPVERAPALTFEQFAEYWKKLKGYSLVRPQDNASRIKTVSNFKLPNTGQRFGDLPVEAITASHIEDYR